MTKTAVNIGTRLAGTFIQACVNYETSGMQAIRDCAIDLDLSYAGVYDVFVEVIQDMLKNDSRDIQVSAKLWSTRR